MTKSLVPQGLLFLSLSFHARSSAKQTRCRDTIHRMQDYPVCHCQFWGECPEKLGGGIIWREWGQNSLSLWEGAGQRDRWLCGQALRGGGSGEDFVEKAGSALQRAAEEGIQKDLGTRRAATTLFEVKPSGAICIGSEGSSQRAKGWQGTKTYKRLSLEEKGFRFPAGGVETSPETCRTPCREHPAGGWGASGV